MKLQKIAFVTKQQDKAMRKALCIDKGHIESFTTQVLLTWQTNKAHYLEKNQGLYYYPHQKTLELSLKSCAE